MPDTAGVLTAPHDAPAPVAPHDASAPVAPHDASAPVAPHADPAAWTAATRAALAVAGLDAMPVAAMIRTALAEDLSAGPDVTTAATVAPGTVVRARFTARQPGVLAGGPVARAVLDTVTAMMSVPPAEVVQALPDGSALTPGSPAIVVRAHAVALLTAERTALNLLCHLSGVATATRRWVDAVAGTGARIRDTRKTLPGLRALEKYAVRCGGGSNHRMGLGDAALIKDNHIAAAGSVAAAIVAVRAARPDIGLQVEVDDLGQLESALQAGARAILLDNFGTEATAAAVRTVRASHPGVLLESSGGLSIERAAEVAGTGVDFLAVGALTHSAPALDLGLDIESVAAPPTLVG